MKTQLSDMLRDTMCLANSQSCIEPPSCKKPNHPSEKAGANQITETTDTQSGSVSRRAQIQRERERDEKYTEHNKAPRAKHHSAPQISPERRRTRHSETQREAPRDA